MCMHTHTTIPQSREDKVQEKEMQAKSAGFSSLCVSLPLSAVQEVLGGWSLSFEKDGNNEDNLHCLNSYHVLGIWQTSFNTHKNPVYTDAILIPIL